jgi:O-antigen chain-terminating methyltransferase
VNAVYASRSWRITAPLRWVGKSARWFVRGSIAWLTFAPMSRPRRVLRKAVIHLKLYVSARPRLKAIALRWLSPSPALKERLRKVGSQPQPEPRTSTIQQTTECAAQAEATTTVEGLEQLSPRARRIYNDLKTAIVQRHKENN